MPRNIQKQISSRIIVALLDIYGKSKYAHDDDCTEYISYFDKQNPGATLVIDLKYKKDNYEPYIEVRLSDKKGRIVQTDCYEVLFETDLYQISTQKKGCDIEYIDEKVAYVGSRKTESKAELEKKMKELVRRNKLLEEQNNRLMKNSEQEFLNSHTYIEMNERMQFIEKMNKLTESALAIEKSKQLQGSDNIAQILKDNEEMLAHYSEEEYFVGITRNWKNAWECEKLQKEINRLKGQISASSIIMIQKDDEIKKMHATIAKLQKQLKDKTTVVDNLCSNEKAISDVKVEEAEFQILQRQKEREKQYKKRGRKTSITEETAVLINTLREKGYSIRDIATQTSLSVGSVHAFLKTQIMNGNK
ncbi:MAG: hypothetical protein UHN47_05580 [Lachnospiraceae bacterium]|nr:hypothetical protein [Lachnospiraceae bacterium]